MVLSDKSFLPKVATLFYFILFFYSGAWCQSDREKLNSITSQIFSISFDISLGESIRSIKDKMEKEKVEYEVVKTTSHGDMTRLTFKNNNESPQEVVLVFWGGELKNIHSSIFSQLPEALYEFLSETHSISFDPRGTVCECAYSIGKMMVGFDFSLDVKSSHANIYSNSSYLVIVSPQFQSGGAWNIHILSSPIKIREKERADIFKKVRCGIFNTSGEKRAKLIDCYNKLDFSCG